MANANLSNVKFHKAMQYLQAKNVDLCLAFLIDNTLYMDSKKLWIYIGENFNYLLDFESSEEYFCICENPVVKIKNFTDFQLFVQQKVQNCSKSPLI